MSDTTFVANVTPITASWLNEVNDFVYTHDFKNIKDYGGGTDKTAAENTAALLAAWAVSDYVEADAGTYAFTAGTNFAGEGRVFKGRGMVVMDFSAGSGVGFKIDAGGSGANLRNMRLENIIFKGGPAITDIFYSRGIVASQFRNLQAREGTATGFKILFGVLNTYDNCRVSNDDTAMTTSPARYWYLDNDGTVGNRTQANTFINCDASGAGASSVSFGWTLVDATLNAWYGGTSESMRNGIQIQDDQCRNNSWYNFDLEGNTVYDVEIRGFANSFYTCAANSASSSPTINNISGVNTAFYGGYMRRVELTSGSSNTTFYGTHFEDDVSLGITGVGTYKAYGITEGNGYTTSVARKDVLGASSTAPAFVVSQGVTPTVTMTKNEYFICGQFAYVQASFAFTSAGTAANSILVDIPAAITTKASAVFMPVGSFIFNKGGVRTSGVVRVQSQVQLSFIVNQGTSLFGINPATTIASGDTLDFTAVIPLQ